MNKQKILLTFFFTSIMALCFSPLINSYIHKDDWKKRTSPLPKETISTLCKNLTLDNSHPLCNDTKGAYASDFSEILRDYFPLEDSMETHKSQATITYQEVKNVLGKFEWECQEIIHAADISYFRCLYDLRGDRYWIDAFYFYYPEQTLFSIRSGSLGDD